MYDAKALKLSLNSGESEETLHTSLYRDVNDSNIFVGQKSAYNATSASNREEEDRHIVTRVGRETNITAGGKQTNARRSPGPDFNTKFMLSKEIQTVNHDSSHLAPIISHEINLKNNLDHGNHSKNTESTATEKMQEIKTSSHDMAIIPTKIDNEKHRKKNDEALDSNHNEERPNFLKIEHVENSIPTHQHSLLTEESFFRSESSEILVDQKNSGNSTNTHETILPQPTEKLKPKKIHIIGMGPTGQYIAHHISQLNHAPAVILLMHDPLLMQKWHDEGAAIRILKNDKIFTQTGFHIESSSSFQTSSPDQKYFGFGKNLEHTTKPPDYAIDNLIVATNSFVTIAALNSIKHRIMPTTIVCIIEKGMGVVQKLNKLFFTNSTTRPTYVLGQLSHELIPTEYQFTHIENGPAELYCSKLPRVSLTKLDLGGPVERIDFSWSPEAKHLVGTLLRVPEFNTLTLGHKDFHVKQLLSLATNAVIEPLAVAFDCANGELLYNYGVTYFMRKLLQEISQIITSLPELRNIKNIQQIFSPEHLERKIIGHLQHSKVTVSPMLVDLRAGQRTSIDFYTGYLIERAIELEIPCPINQMIYNLVRGKQTIKRRKDNHYIPIT